MCTQIKKIKGHFKPVKSQKQKSWGQLGDLLTKTGHPCFEA